MKLYLDLEWIFSRFASETSFNVYEAERHPVRRLGFLLGGIEPHHRVLDLGCANGVMTSAIAQKAEVVGIDHDPDSIATARRTYPQLDFEAGDAREYLRTAPKFDVLILSHILEHLDDPEAFLRDVAGNFDKIYIEVPDFEASYLNQMRLEQGSSLLYQDADHVAEFDRAELKAIISAAGLKVVEEDYSFGVMRFWCKR